MSQLPTNSCQLTLYDTLKRRRPNSEDDMNIIFIDNDHFNFQYQEYDLMSLSQTVINDSSIADSPIVESTPPRTTLVQLSNSTIYENVPPSDIAQGPQDKPVQPSRYAYRFPLTIVGTKKGSFNPDWFVTYSWLEYSLERDAAFCYPCRIFKPDSGKDF